MKNKLLSRDIQALWTWSTAFSPPWPHLSQPFHSSLKTTPLIPATAWGKKKKKKVQYSSVIWAICRAPTSVILWRVLNILLLRQHWVWQCSYARTNYFSSEWQSSALKFCMKIIRCGLSPYNTEIGDLHTKFEPEQASHAAKRRNLSVHPSTSAHCT